MNRQVQEENTNQHVLVFFICLATFSVPSNDRVISALVKVQREAAVTQY
jgi:hypothetical protein